ncbi:MAG: serine/threonine-protein kinase, partial [Myxococcota bacterium]
MARPVAAQHDWPTPLVIKRMHVALIAQPELHARFQHEARIAQALSTPHVPRVHVVGEAEGTSYIAMDYVPGWTLSQILRARNSDERRPSLASTASIIGGILDGLIALHEAKDPKTGQALTALHRDLAPKNIMLGDDGVTRLIDLGLGKSSVQEWQTTTGVIMGTPGYMAPEQIFAGSTDVRTDLYTVGVVLWELIAGQFYIKRGPIHGMLREQVQAEARPLPDNIDAPQALKPVLQTAVARSPEARFETARAFRAAFREAMQDELPPSAPGPVDELITRELWAELEAARDELMDLTEAITVARPPAEPFVVETDDDPSAEETHDLPDRTEVGRPPMHLDSYRVGPDGVDAVDGG